MLRLIGFGGLTLLQAGAPLLGAAAGRRRLALLALLTTSGARGIDRDALAESLWPDSDPPLARHSLHQLISAMRRAYGCDDLLVGTPTLHLERRCITSDVWEFEDAIRQRQFEAAVALYHGPFADGFSLPGAPEVQRRLEASRVVYSREYHEALESLALHAASRDDVRGSARWWRLRADADPLSGRAARGLIEALVALDDRAQALQFALIHQSLVRQELDSAADPEITQWIVRLRGMRDTPVRESNGSRTADRQTLSAVARDSTINDEPQSQRRLARVARAVGAKYRLEGLIDESSVTSSYAAIDASGTNQSVEVHVIHPHIGTTTNATRFGDVLTKVSRLAHPNIVAVVDFGVSGDVLYYVTVPRGPDSLRRRLARSGALPIHDAVSIARGIADALGEAHSNGVCHGDLRPKHVDLTSRGPRLGGLGVIEAIMPDAGARDGSTVVTYGSPAYLSPEQLTAGASPDPRSDVYAAGCILYEMLAGDPPFGRPSRASTIGTKLTQSAAPVRARRESTPEELERIVHACLARVPADRYSSGSELARALAEFVSLLRP